MSFYFRPADDRGSTRLNWLNSQHTFSFGHYYDPRHPGFSVLRVINDDRVIAGAGFGTHGHDNMEIISYVLDGTIKHKDSMGHDYEVKAGEIQIMSAGTGVTHSEFNGSDQDNLHFLQIWVLPEKQNIKPRYAQMMIDQTQPLTPVISPDGDDHQQLWINQDATVSRLQLDEGESYDFSFAPGRQYYLHMISGAASGLYSLQAGDGLGIIPDRDHGQITADRQLTALWFDLPAD